MSRRTFRFSLLIVLIAACAVASIPLAIESISSALSPSPPTRMPSLPLQAEAIIGIESEYFFQTSLTVRTTDGHIYTTDGDAWQRTDQSYPAKPVLCTRTQRRRFQTTIGPISDCAQVQQMGEWCPAPVASYAIDSEGQLWEHLAETPCYPILCLFSVFNGAKVLAAGTVIVILIAITGSLISRCKQRK